VGIYLDARDSWEGATIYFGSCRSAQPARCSMGCLPVLLAPPRNLG
jgi:hypothetical protein